MTFNIYKSCCWCYSTFETDMTLSFPGTVLLMASWISWGLISSLQVSKQLKKLKVIVIHDTYMVKYLVLLYMIHTWLNYYIALWMHDIQKEQTCWKPVTPLSVLPATTASALSGRPLPFNNAAFLSSTNFPRHFSITLFFTTKKKKKC